VGLWFSMEQLDPERGLRPGPLQQGRLAQALTRGVDALNRCAGLKHCSRPASGWTLLQLLAVTRPLRLIVIDTLLVKQAGRWSASCDHVPLPAPGPTGAAVQAERACPRALRVPRLLQGTVPARWVARARAHASLVGWWLVRTRVCYQISDCKLQWCGLHTSLPCSLASGTLCIMQAECAQAPLASSYYYQFLKTKKRG